jgi:hypothetical protein
LDAVELALDTVELAAQLPEGPAVLGLVAIELRQDLAAALHDGPVFPGTRLVEQRGDLLVCHVPDALDVEQGRLSAERLDLLHQPLESLRRLRDLGQDPGRAPEPDGAHPLELPPDAHAMSGRRGGQCGQQGEPAHRL